MKCIFSFAKGFFLRFFPPKHNTIQYVLYLEGVLYMKNQRPKSKRAQVTVLAVVLAAALAASGTLAWRSISQLAINEVPTDGSEPGGRVHDDFKGEENKDVYVENYTSLEKGEPVFARIRLLEYMETGADAGVNRDALDRDAASILEGANINQPSTWHVHKPGESETDDPFHKYWSWDFGGATTYMPTFNKNSDSLSVDVNGTYVGPNKVYDDVDPYKDYKAYAEEETKKALAYYDADANAEDEYDPTAEPAQTPGGGGTEWSEANPTGNYTKKEETHTAQSTLTGLGVLTMEQWKGKGCPVGNYWVWDTDGWAYWAKPIMPQTATGLFLTKLNKVSEPTEKSYYAIEVVGQLADAYQWGEDGTEDPGFYADGFTGDAKALLDQAASLKLGGDNKWYLPKGQNVYVQIMDDEGNVSDPICAGADGKIGTTDDRTDVLYAPGGIDIGDKHYDGDYFLKPTDDDPYYRTPGADNELGKAPDDKFWVPDGASYPDGAVSAVADAVTVTGPDTLDAGAADAAFSATVKLGEAESYSQRVTWSVATTDGTPVAEGTAISADGKLTIADAETSSLIVTATSWLDPDVTQAFTVTVLPKPTLKITLQEDSSVPTQIQAGKSLQLQAKMCRGDELVDPQPASITWSVTNTPAARAADTGAVTAAGGLLKVGRKLTGTVTVTAQGTVNSETKTATLTLEVTPPEEVTVTLSGGASTIEPGDTTGVTYVATLNGPTDELADTGVNWEAGKSSNSGETIETITGVSITGGKLVLPANYSFTNGATLWVKATAKDPTANNASAKTSIAVTPPAKINISGASGGQIEVRFNGTPTTLTAAVLKSDDTEYGSQAVTWWAGDSSGNPIEGVTMDANTGALTVASSVDRDTQITVKATSKIKSDVVGTATVVKYSNTITIGSVKFYKMYEDTDQHRMLILSVDCVGKGKTAMNWEDSPIRTWLNDTWLPSVAGLSDRIWKDGSGKCATFYTPKYREDGWHTHNDAVFLLSAYDLGVSGVGGFTNAAESYTANGKKLPYPDDGTDKSAWIAKLDGVATEWWTRSTEYIGFAGAGDSMCKVGTDGGSGFENFSAESEYGIRPACWISIP